MLIAQVWAKQAQSALDTNPRDPNVEAVGKLIFGSGFWDNSATVTATSGMLISLCTHINALQELTILLQFQNDLKLYQVSW